ncbi:hypothetical protein C6502_16020 [Candidatus Poribacteria bacterium]|nr:MAG: hypothetical protein C6502_16020 [Candidatus Poribacteria bacterium]
MRIVMFVVCLWLATSPLYGKIVFHSTRDGNTEIYKMSSDGSSQTRLTFNEASDTYPVWSPDGRQIVFQSNRDGNDEIYVMDADGRNQRNLTRHPKRDIFPDWHPDGEQIAFASDREGGKNHNSNIFVMDTDGGNVQQITDLYAFSSRPKWAPDGTRIAFDADFDKPEQGKPRQVYIINADGSHRWQVSNASGQNTTILHGWSPDGQQILYTQTIDGRFDDVFLMVATLAPNEPGWIQQVFGELAISLLIPVIGSAFSPDGKSILYVGKEDDHWNIYRLPHPEGNKQQLTDDIHDNFAPHESLHEWNPRLPVSLQRLTPTRWGEIKVTK